MLTNTNQGAQRPQTERIHMKSFNRMNRSFLAAAVCAAITLVHTSILNADGLPVKRDLADGRVRFSERRGMGRDQQCGGFRRDYRILPQQRLG